ncbi:hypothetical protein [Bradyrhizobium diversitatis]|uniref:hypothetical protein n=1 Tax=Bradyrhizobium diversitatis TaxID=2755406 RepID=UPI001FE80EF2|nr:hypothetical protein [Bradyrhizobium diversitatis]
MRSGPVLWDMGRIAMSDHPQALSLFRKILLASASVPGAFPPVHIKVRAADRTYEELHVDGGVTQQVFVPRPSTVIRSDASTKRTAARLFIIRKRKDQPGMGGRRAGHLLDFTEVDFHPDQEPEHWRPLSHLCEGRDRRYRFQSCGNPIELRRDEREVV